MKDRFYLGAFQFTLYAPWFYDYQKPYYFPMYKKLSFNLGHAFTWDYDIDIPYPGYNSKFDGGFYDSVSAYLLNVTNMLSAWNSNFHLNSTLLERVKVLKPAFGQRSTYEAEANPYIIRPGYGFEITGGAPYSENWRGKHVSGRYSGLLSNPFYLVKKLYENREQVNVWWSGKTGNAHDMTYNLSDIKQYPYRWFIKPRMRIDSAFAKTHQSIPVAAVIIKNFLGNTIDSTVITCRNFLHYDMHTKNYFYDGSYKEIFEFPDNDTVLSVEARQLTGGTDAHDLIQSKVDFQIYWFGKVEVWLDYVRVDDEWAHYLFNPELDTWHKYDFVWKIRQEAKELSLQSGFGYFYMDEQYYNNLPCIAEVNRLIKEVNPNTGIVLMFNDNYLSQGPVFKNPPSWADGYEFLYTTGAVTDMVFTDIYPWNQLNTSESAGILPHNIRLPNPDKFPGTKRYVKAVNSTQYNDVTQNILENGLQFNSNFHTGGFLDCYRKCARLIQVHPDIVLNLAIQSHSYENDLQYNEYAMCTREPTNEEISLQCYLGLTYGAKLITHFMLQTSENAAPNYPGKFYYNWGLLDSDNVHVRDTNYYGQCKWDSVLHIDSVISKIGNIMYPEGESYHFRWEGASCVNTYPVNSTHSSYNPLPYKYIKDLISYYRNPKTGNFDNESTDLPFKRYWEIGFFMNPNDTASKYFILVNKRLTPEDVYNNGDLRKVRLYFSRNDAVLARFSNFKLTDMLTGESITFNIEDTKGVMLPVIFMPGEGKLYKMEPAE